MATSLFERIVPHGNDAVFPFQISTAGLSVGSGLTVSVYEVAGSNGAVSTVSSGITVTGVGGGLYTFKLANGDMSSGDMYFAVVTATSSGEVVRIPLWSYAPTNHVSDVLDRLGGSAAAMSFSGILSSATDLQGGVQGLANEMGDVSAAGITGSPASVAAALKLIFDEAHDAASDAAHNKTEIGSNSDSASLSGSLFAAIKQVAVETDNIDSALTTIDSEIGTLQTDATAIKNEIGDVSTFSFSSAGSSTTVASALKEIWDLAKSVEADVGTVDGIVDNITAAVGGLSDGASGDYATDKTLMAMVRKLGADVAAVYGKVDSEVNDILTAVGAENDGASSSASYSSGSLHSKIRRLGELAEHGTNGLANIKSEATAAKDAAEAAQTVVEHADYGNEALKDILLDASTGLPQIKGYVDTLEGAIGTDADDLHTKIGAASDASSGSSMFAKINGMQAKVDALTMGEAARILPQMPETIFVGGNIQWTRIVVIVQDGASGSNEAPDPEVDGGSSDGHVGIKVFRDGSDISASSNGYIYEDTSSTALTAATAKSADSTATLEGYQLMKYSGSTGVFEVYLKLPAYDDANYSFEFRLRDSDLNAQPVASAYFTAARSLTTRSAIAPTGSAIGAF